MFVKEEHNLPVHPRSKFGFRSIGCATCTAVVGPAEEDDRAGRWAGIGKQECGLHTEMFNQKNFTEARPNSPWMFHRFRT